MINAVMDVDKLQNSVIQRFWLMLKILCKTDMLDVYQKVHINFVHYCANFVSTLMHTAAMSISLCKIVRSVTRF